MITSSFDLFGRCEFVRLTEELASLPFTCGDSDLEDFFHNEAVLYAKARLGKTYCFIDNNGGKRSFRTRRTHKNEKFYYFLRTDVQNQTHAGTVAGCHL